MNLKKEADLLEQVLSIAETDYAQAYRFLLDAYEKSPAAYGPQTLYFLSCLSGGTGLSEAALGWLKKSRFGERLVVSPGGADRRRSRNAERQS